MSDRPILFSGPMVRAILSGATETRRVVKFLPGMDEPQQAYGGLNPPYVCDRLEPCDWIEGHLAWFSTAGGCTCRKAATAYAYEGDRLWVRETWATWSYLDKTKPSDLTPGQSLSYHATPGLLAGRWRPSIHMPRWASRLTLAVDAVRVERLHDIDDAGARAEGVADREAYRVLWCDINGAASWDANPWVWVVGFSRVQP